MELKRGKLVKSKDRSCHLLLVCITKPLDSGEASSAACRQGKKDIGRSRKKKEKKGKKEEEDKDEDEDLIRLHKGRNNG